MDASRTTSPAFISFLRKSHAIAVNPRMNFANTTFFKRRVAIPPYVQWPRVSVFCWMYSCKTKDRETLVVQNRTLGSAVKQSIIDKNMKWPTPELALLEGRRSQFALAYGPWVGVMTDGNGGRTEHVGLTFRRIVEKLVNPKTGETLAAGAD